MFALSRVLADRKLLGREPAYWVGLGQAAIALLVTFNLSGLSAEQASLWVAAVIAIGTVLEAWTVRATLLAALVGATKAVLVLGIGYGLPITDTQVGLLAALVTVAGSGWLRTQTSPASTPISDGAALPVEQVVIPTESTTVVTAGDVDVSG